MRDGKVVLVDLLRQLRYLLDFGLQILSSLLLEAERPIPQLAAQLRHFDSQLKEFRLANLEVLEHERLVNLGELLRSEQEVPSFLVSPSFSPRDSLDE